MGTIMARTMAYNCERAIYSILLLMIAMVSFVEAQTPPIGWTEHYRLRKWGQGANPGADSLNANWTDIDRYIYSGLRGQLTFDSTVTSRFIRFYKYRDTTKAWVDLEGGPDNPKLRFRVRDNGAFSSGIYATLSAVSKGADSTYAEVFAAADGRAGFGHRRPTGSVYAFTIQSRYDSTTFSAAGVHAMTVRSDSVIFYRPTNITGGAGDTWTRGSLKLYQKNAGDKVYIRAAAGDTTMTHMLNVYGDIGTTNDVIAKGKLQTGDNAANVAGILRLMRGSSLDPFFVDLLPGAPTANRSIVAPDASGTIALLVGGQTWSGTGLQVNFNADKWDNLDAPSNAVGFLKNDGAGNLSWSNITGAVTSVSAPDGSAITASPTTGDVVINHLDTDGYKHVPSGGAANQILAYGGAAGTAAWTSMSDAIHGNRGGGSLHAAATTTAAGFMSAADKTKLDGIATNADNYGGWSLDGSNIGSGYNVTFSATGGLTISVSGTNPRTVEYGHSNAAGFKHIPSGGAAGQVLVYGGSSGTAAWGTIDAVTVTSVSAPDGSAITASPTTGDVVINHLNTDGYKHVPSGGSANQILAYGGAAGTAAWTSMSDAIHGNRGGGSLHAAATTTAAGFMSAADKTKLNGIADGADNYGGWSLDGSNIGSGYNVTFSATGGLTISVSGTNPRTVEYGHSNAAGFKHIPSGGSAGQVLMYGGSSGTAVWATLNAVTSVSAPDGSAITASPTTGDVVINHLDTDGYKHVPSGGSANQILAYGGAAGTAAWASMSDAIHGNLGGGSLHAAATTTTAGFMSAADKTKLNGIADGADNYGGWSLDGSNIASGYTVNFLSSNGLSVSVSGTNPRSVTYGITAGGIQGDRLADGAVTAAKIANNTITDAKMSTLLFSGTLVVQTDQGWRNFIFSNGVLTGVTQ
jgi:hypothetical protein